MILDTFVYHARPFAVKDISVIVKDEQPSGLLPAAMQVGAAGYSVLHVINEIAQDGEIEAKNIGISAGVYLAGMILKRFIKSSYTIGKKYRLQYISATGW